MSETMALTVAMLAEHLGSEPTVTYGATGNGDPVALILTHDGALISVDEFGQIQSTRLPDVPWQAGTVSPA